MAEMPRDPAPDATFALMRDGYEFIGKRCTELGSDVFRTRLAMQEVICLRGADEARLFYDEKRFKREGAAPGLARKTLFGEGAVHGLDDEPHRHRKAMFMSLMTAESIGHLTDLVGRRWRARGERWAEQEEVVVFEASARVLTEAVCEWAAVPLMTEEVEQRTQEFLALLEGPASIGIRQWRARRARASSEEWLTGIIEQVRAGELNPPEGSALRTVAEHQDPEGELLDLDVAAVELNNLLRPVVAVSRWVVFAALALHDHPEYRERLREADEEGVERFVQEVRRFYPFFPFLGAIVRQDFEWRGFQFNEGTRVLLDLYGTDHHPTIWIDPETFRPERFLDWDGGAFDFIPQGGGDHYTHHRCPGEWITIAVLKSVVRQLVDGMDYNVPDQDLAYDLGEIPSLPESGFIMRGVRMLSSPTAA